MIRVFIIALTPMQQAGLQALLASTDIHVVGTAPAVRESTALPDADVIIVADDLQLADVVRALPNRQAVALVTLTNNEERTLAILRNTELRGWGMVPLEVPAVQLQAAVVAAAQGLAVFPAQLTQKLEVAQALAVETLELAGIDEALTPREHEVLELVGQGLSNKLIARALSISEHTVKFHLSSISTKLGASSRTDAVRRGLRRGLITL